MQLAITYVIVVKSLEVKGQSYLKELLGLLELQGVLRGLRLSLVGRRGLVCDETVVWDHYGGREDRGGDEDGVAVDLLHGE